MQASGDKRVTIYQVENGFILVDSANKSHVVENGNEIDMMYAIQRYFGFVAIEPQPTEEGDSSTKILDENTV